MNKPTDATVDQSAMQTAVSVGLANTVTPKAAQIAAGGTVFAVLGAISFAHFINDMIQSLVPAIYPMLKDSFHLSFGQIGLITLTFQVTASLLQPAVGLYTDRKPQPFSLAIGMGCTLLGLLLLSRAWSYGLLLAAAGLVGMGSSVFHPESSRVARMASGGRYGLAQSLFQVGGNAGQSLGPLLAAFIVIPGGQGSIAWFSLAALLAMAVLFKVGKWYASQRGAGTKKRGAAREQAAALPRGKVMTALAVLVVLIFSKYFYLASLNSYYTFYLIDKFGVSVQSAQVHLFIFLAAVAAGTLIGGPVGDRIGRKYVIWGSILGVLPFTLAAAPRQPVLDQRAHRADRPDPGLGLLGDPRLCAGAGAREGRHDRRAVLRLRLRHGRHRRGRARRARRPHQHRLRLPGLRLPAPDRRAHGLPSRSRAPARPGEVGQPTSFTPHSSRACAAVRLSTTFPPPADCTRSICR